MNGSFEKLTRWAGLIRDLGLIIGVPILITIGISLYQQQIEVLKARNELLRETQYDRALSLIKSQKELFEIDRNNLENKINDLTKSRGTKDREIKALKERLSQINKEIDTLNQSEKIIGRSTFSNSWFREDVDFYAARFAGRVNFHAALFSDEVYFKDARFSDRIYFDRADLRRASFFRSDMRGVDLSKAIIDEYTKLPKLNE